MRYNTKQLFQNASSNVAREFSNITGMEGSPEFPSKRPGVDKTKLDKLKEAFLEAGQGDYMKAYNDTLKTLQSAQRNMVSFASAKVGGLGMSRPTMARASSFAAIPEASAQNLIKANRARMKDFVISKAYLKA